MTPRHARAALVLACALWVLGADVYVAFPRVRERLIDRPLPPARQTTLSLAGADHVPGTELVVTARLRNTGSTPLDVTASDRNARVLRRLRLDAGASSPVDLVFDRQSALPQEITFAANDDAFVMQAAEISNAHGFSRGLVDLIVLPTRQPFRRVPWFVALFALAAAIPLASDRHFRVPIRVRTSQRAMAASAAVVFGAIAVAPFVSAYRVVIAPHTFVLLYLLLLNDGVTALSIDLGQRVWSRRTRLRVLASTRGMPILLGAALILYAAFIWQHMGAYAGGADSSSYLNSARLLARGSARTTFRPTPGIPPEHLSPYARQPIAFDTAGGTMAPVVPVGLPLMLAATAWFTGWDRAPGVVEAFHAVVGVLLVYLLARRFALARLAAFACGVIVGTSPLYVLMSLQTMSDVPAMVWTTAAVLCAWKGRSDRRWIAVAGAAVSVAVLIRPTDVLVLLPIAVALGTDPRSWLVLIAGGIPGAALLAVYNVHAYGGALRTGYGSLGTAFHLATIPASVRNYAAWLPVIATPLVILAPLLMVVRGNARVRLLLLSWALAFLAFYAAYEITPESWWTLRFLLPALPALVMASVSFAVHAASRTRRPRVAAVLVAALATLAILSNMSWSRRLGAADIGRGESLYPEVASWVRAQVPPGSVILAGQFSGALFYYTDLPLVRWDIETADTLRQIEADVTAAAGHLFAVRHPTEPIDQRAFNSLPGRWERLHEIRGATVWRFAGPD